MTALAGLRPVAKALGESCSKTYMLGMGICACWESSRTMAYTRGASLSGNSLAR